MHVTPDFLDIFILVASRVVIILANSKPTIMRKQGMPRQFVSCHSRFVTGRWCTSIEEGWKDSRRLFLGGNGSPLRLCIADLLIKTSRASIQYDSFLS